MDKRLLGIIFSTLIFTTGCSMDMDISEDIKRELETKYGVDWEEKLEKQYLVSNSLFIFSLIFPSIEHPVVNINVEIIIPKSLLSIISLLILTILYFI